VDAQSTPIRRGVSKNITIDFEAAAILEAYGPAKTQGRFISQVLIDYRAREEERARLKAPVEEARRDE
jgi:hypothetical protein